MRWKNRTEIPAKARSKGALESSAQQRVETRIVEGGKEVIVVDPANSGGDPIGGHNVSPGSGFGSSSSAFGGGGFGGSSAQSASNRGGHSMGGGGRRR